MKSNIPRFPQDEQVETAGDNPAIQLYGRRFYKDQTPVEYLAEFLLVFASQKGHESGERGHEYSFALGSGPKPKYWPADRVALKLFAFFPSSKLDTRHPVHQQEYTNAIELIKDAVSGTQEEREEVVRLTQSLFSGFVGVAGNRTWVTHSFLPASVALLARELNWSHAKALKHLTHDNSWEDSLPYFQDDRHNFMARGGELLFLQLAHLFSQECAPEVNDTNGKLDLHQLRRKVETGLRSVLSNDLESIDGLASFIENVLRDYRYRPGKEVKPASLGWVPASTLQESLLFATEISNICSSTVGSLEKLDLLQTLCCLQVLRSLCFQASRVDEHRAQTDGFVGNYAWVLADHGAPPDCSIRKLAQSSFEHIEELLYRVLRLNLNGATPQSLTEADKHGFQIFRKLAKEIGLVVPPKGKYQRFALSPKLLRFLVAALIPPGRRIRLTEFYDIAFRHYGIALGERQLAIARYWIDDGLELSDYSGDLETGWVEEALQQGGFLVELSDAVSIVHNPGQEKQEQ